MAKGRKTGGRQPGTPNKMTADLRAMISAALVEAGGKKYLVEQAAESPAAFLKLLGQTLPKDVNLNASGSLSLTMYLSTCPPPKSATSTSAPA
jgi:hypothetical protein